MRSIVLIVALFLLPTRLFAQEDEPRAFEHEPLENLIVPEVEEDERISLSGDLRDAGISELDGESWETAARQLEVSYILHPDPEVLLPLARAMLGLGHRDAAIERLQRLLDEHPNQESESCVRARAMVEELAPSRVSVSIATEPPGATLYVDDGLRGTTPLDPPLMLSIGEYRLRIALEGYSEHSDSLVVRAGEPMTLNIRLQEELRANRDTRGLSVALWTVVGLTALSAAGLTLAAVMGATGTRDLEDSLEPTQAASEAVESWVDTSFWMAGITGAGLTALIALAVARSRRARADDDR